jgi:hypothetical protein
VTLQLVNLEYAMTLAETLKEICRTDIVSLIAMCEEYRISSEHSDDREQFTFADDSNLVIIDMKHVQTFGGNDHD